MQQIPFLDLHYFSMFQVVQLNSVERYGLSKTAFVFSKNIVKKWEKIVYASTF